MESLDVRVLGLLADLERLGAGTEIDEYRLARALDLIPATMPPHAYTISPLRGRFLRVLTALEEGRCVYTTKNGFWRLRLTAAGRQRLALASAAPVAPAAEVPAIPAPPAPRVPVAMSAPPIATPVWQAPRTAQVKAQPRSDQFTGLALGVAVFGALLVFAFTTLLQGPLAPEAAAKPQAPVGAALPVAALPVAPVAPAVEPTPPATAPPAPAAKRAYVVANTGGAGVYLRRTPQLNDRLAAWPEQTRLEEVGPPIEAGGLTWRHVRAPDGKEGYVPAQYTSEAP